MKSPLRLIFALVLYTAVEPVQAHDPAEHAREAAAATAGPDCAAGNGLDQSKMDPDDPIMKAIRIQCGSAMEHDGKPAATTENSTQRGEH